MGMRPVLKVVTHCIIVVLPSDPGGRGSRFSITMANGPIGYFTTEVFQCQKKVACECVCGGGGVCAWLVCVVCACIKDSSHSRGCMSVSPNPLILTPSHTHTPSYPYHTYRPCQLQSTPPQCLVLVLSSVPAPSFPTLKKWQEMSVSHKFKHHFQITMETKMYLA